MPSAMNLPRDACAGIGEARHAGRPTALDAVPLPTLQLDDVAATTGRWLEPPRYAAV